MIGVQVEFRGDKVVTTAYMDDFPFPYYVALQVRVYRVIMTDAL